MRYQGAERGGGERYGAEEKGEYSRSPEYTKHELLLPSIEIL